MAFGKQAKTPKTQYQTEAQQLGRDAYGRITPTLNRVENLTMNPDDYRKEHINDLFNSGAQWNDAMRNYRRQMSAATANNYNATGGGYSSSGQRLYDDVQRGLNDYNARLYDTGVRTVEDLLSNDRSAANSYYKTLLNQHAMASQPDALDSYNQMLDKQNKNWWSNALGGIGNAVEQYAPGYFKLIGSAMKTGAYAGSTDYSNALNGLGREAGLNVNYRSPAYSNLGGILSSAANNYMNWGGGFSGGGGAGNLIGNLFTNSDGSTSDFGESYNNAQGTVNDFLRRRR